MYLPCKALQAATALSLEEYYRAKGSSQQSVADIISGRILRPRTWSQMLRDALNQTTSNMVVKEVIAAFGLMLFGSLILVGMAPSPRVACASVVVIAVISLESAMVEQLGVNVGKDGEDWSDGRVVNDRIRLCGGDCLYTTMWQAKGRCDPSRSRSLPLRITHSTLHCRLSDFGETTLRDCFNIFFER